MLSVLKKIRHKQNIYTGVNLKNPWLVITEPFSPFFRDKKDYIFMQPEVSVFGELIVVFYAS